MPQRRRVKQGKTKTRDTRQVAKETSWRKYKVNKSSTLTIRTKGSHQGHEDHELLYLYTLSAENQLLCRRLRAVLMPYRAACSTTLASDWVIHWRYGLAMQDFRSHRTSWLEQCALLEDILDSSCSYRSDQAHSTYSSSVQSPPHRRLLTRACRHPNFGSGPGLYSYRIKPNRIFRSSN